MFSLVLVPDRFHRNAYALAYESLKHKKTPNLSNEPVLCLHTTDHLAELFSQKGKERSSHRVHAYILSLHAGLNKRLHLSSVFLVKYKEMSVGVLVSVLCTARNRTVSSLLRLVSLSTGELGRGR